MAERSAGAPEVATSPDQEASAAEQFHVHDPTIEHWNESWLVSWLPTDGQLAGTFRLGTLPNQGRAWLWLWLWTGEEWVTLEETRLDHDHLEPGNGVAYDRWGLRVAYQPLEPLERGRLTIEGVGRIRSGPRSGGLTPVRIDLECEGRSPAYATGSADDDAGPYPADRFEQSLWARGTVVVDGVEATLSCPAHRDRSWGPRTWQYPFMLGDLQSDDRQVYFAAGPNAEGGRGKGYIREGDEIAHITSVAATMAYDDEHATIGRSQVGFGDDRGRTHTYVLEPVAPSVQFDVAHTGVPPRHWLYWRTLVRATPEGGGPPVIGWFEANRFPYPG